MGVDSIRNDPTPDLSNMFWKGKQVERDLYRGLQRTVQMYGNMGRFVKTETRTWLLASFSEVRRPTRPGSLWWKLCIALKR